MDNTVHVYNAATYTCLVWDNDQPIKKRYHVFCNDHYNEQNCPVHPTDYKRR